MAAKKKRVGVDSVSAAFSFLKNKEDAKELLSAGKEMAGQLAKDPGLIKRLVIAFFKDDYTLAEEPKEDFAVMEARQAALIRKIGRRTFIILALLVVIIFLMPVLKPIYQYEALTPDKEKQSLVALDMPNLTDQAILSWAATSITEILTFGFGDFDQRILSQRNLFTDSGWDAFTQAIRDQDMRSTFKLRQLVLTSVPADSPVLVSKGENEEKLYLWIVQMPVIMTYTTNNDVSTRKRKIVQLTIVRVPPSQNEAGIGIKNWELM